MADMELLRIFQGHLEGPLKDTLLKSYKPYMDSYFRYRERTGPQCHPPGTLISTTSSGDVPIEDLKDTDMLVSWDKPSSKIRGVPGNHRSPGASFFRCERDYDDELISIKTLGKTLKFTKDHLCIAKYCDNADDLFVVYLMRKGDYWRVGKTKLFHKLEKSSFGIAMRGVTEHADEAWLLSTHATNTEALLEEEFISCKYGIPKACFTTSLSNKKSKHDGIYKWITQKEIDEHFESLKKPFVFFSDVLKDYGLDIRYPIWIKGKAMFEEINTSMKLGKKNSFVVRASNLNNYMQAGIVNDYATSLLSWNSIEVSRMPYRGKVYSLSVDRYKTYFANGILTHNCPFCKAAVKHIFLSEYAKHGNDFLERVKNGRWEGYS